MGKNTISLVSIVTGSQGSIDKSHVPLGLLYVGSSLKKAGFDVNIYHFFPREIERFAVKIIKNNPLFIGFSVLSGSTTYWSVITSSFIKKMSPDSLIVWGGHHPTLTANECLKEKCIDAVVRGEGEITATELAKAYLDSGIDGLKDVPGLSYKINDQIFHNEDRQLIENLDALPLDYSMLDLEEYFKIRKGAPRNISFFSSRGCPFNCAFCSTPKYTGRVYRSHSAEYVIDHLKFLKKEHGVRSVFFSDDNFFLKKERAKSIIRSLKDVGISCDTVDIRLDQLSEDDLAFFQKNNLQGLFFGWESGNDRILKLMRKNITVDQIMEKVALIGKYKISSWGSGMLLLPTETLEETRQTINFSTRLRKLLNNSTIGLFRFAPLPKTDLTKMAMDCGFRYPGNQKEWIKIDPQEKEYSVEWLPWYNDEWDRKFKNVQDLSRSGIANNNDKGFPFSLVNILAGRINNRFNKLDFEYLWEKIIYDLSRRAYQTIRN